MNANRPAVDSNGSLVAELFLCFMNLCYKFDESFARLWNSLFWPFDKMELSNNLRLAVLSFE